MTVASITELPRRLRDRSKVTVLRSHLVENAMEQHAHWHETAGEAEVLWHRGVQLRDKVVVDFASAIAHRARKQRQAAREAAGRYDGLPEDAA